MQITNKLKIDMTKPDPSLSVNAVQGDAYSRSLCMVLYNGIVPWNIPEGVTAAVRYAKPDRTKGYYDTLPDGSSAWCVEENVLTIRLAPQMLTVPGKITAQIELILGTHVLSTFGLTIHVEPNPAAGVLKSEDYVNWLQWFQEQTEEHVSQIRQSVLAADQAARSALSCQENAESIAGNIAVIVAGNEAYTKSESDHRYSPSIIQTVSGESITILDSTDNPLQKLKVFGRTIQNGTPSPEASVPLESAGAGGSVTAVVCGKNLLKVDFPEETTDGITFSPAGDGGIRVTGTTQNNPFIDAGNVYLQAGKNYCGSLTGTRATGLNFRLIDRTQTPANIAATNENSFSPAQSGWYSFEITVNPGYDGTSLVYPQVELNTRVSVPTEYERFHGDSVTVPTPSSLSGIPVTSGGNYTDNSGQQWICDEVDFVRGVYVQRVVNVISKLTKYQDLTYYAAQDLFFIKSDIGGFKEYTAGGLSSHYQFTTDGLSNMQNGTFKLSNNLYINDSNLNTDTRPAYFEWMKENVSILVETAIPTETKLSAQQLAAFAALRTSYPNTTLFNDGGAFMSADYIADTKLYIDKKYAQLAAAILNH